MGQSNIPAGATIGSNHNSRANDGEIIAGRGFWPGLCVSLKHNSKFASFTILAKADYSFELNIPIPFSLVSVDNAKEQLVVMPAYWFMYNMYALARNSWKYQDRDKHIQPIQKMEYDYLAPDTVNEMFEALSLFEYFTGKAFYKNEKPTENISEDLLRKKGRELLQNNDEIVDSLEIEAEGFENSKRKTVIIKAGQAYEIFVRMINYYGINHLMECIEKNKLNSVEEIQNFFSKKITRTEWVNAGGQLIQKNEMDNLRKKIREGKIQSWEHLHKIYEELAENYRQQKIMHAVASLCEIKNLKPRELAKKDLNNLFNYAIETKEWIAEKIYESRAKDYSNPFRKTVYENDMEMDKVLGRLEDNSFIGNQRDELNIFKNKIALLKKKLELK
jgi:hypothetical protein